MCAMLIAASGCATAIRGSTQRLSVVTEPEGASCTLQTQGDEAIYSIAATPGSTEVKRRPWPIVVICSKPGHLSIVEQFPNIGGAASDSTEQTIKMVGATAGAQVATVGTGVAAVAAASVALVPLGFVALAAWPVAAMIDASSGANHGYPPAMIFVMPPSTFPDSASQNAYFQFLDDRIEATANELRSEHTQKCRMHCAYLRKRMDEEVAEQHKKVALLRERTIIDLGAAQKTMPVSETGAAARTADNIGSTN